MESTSVSSKGQVTIPKALRQRLGIRQGSRVEFSVVGDHVEMRVSGSSLVSSARPSSSGFGLLSTKRKAVPVDLDPATLLQR